MLLLICSSITFSQSKESALRDAGITSQATLKMNFKTVLKHTYPGVVEMMGGKEKTIKILKSTFKTMEKEQDFVFEKAEILGVSEIVKEQNQYRCYIESLNQMTMDGMRIKRENLSY